MPGGQENDTLVARTNIDWCFPFPHQCEETIKEVAKLYLKGDKDLGLKAHQLPVFVDERGRARDKWGEKGGKVLNRLAKASKPFLLDEKDKS